MPTFKAKIRNRRANGFHPVYILCIHQRKSAYIRTDLVVQDSGGNKSGDVVGSHVLMRATALICTYYDKLQGKRTDNLTVKEIVDIVTDSVEERISFVSFAEAHIRKLS